MFKMYPIQIQPVIRVSQFSVELANLSNTIPFQRWISFTKLSSKFNQHKMWQSITRFRVTSYTTHKNLVGWFARTKIHMSRCSAINLSIIKHGNLLFMIFLWTRTRLSLVWSVSCLWSSRTKNYNFFFSRPFLFAKPSYSIIVNDSIPW